METYIHVAIATFFVVTTLIPISMHEGWMVRYFDFPRLQLSVLIVVHLSILIAQSLYQSPLYQVILVSNLLCLLYQLFWIIPYTKLFPVEAAQWEKDSPDACISILTVNVLTSNRQSEALLRIIERTDPDLIVTLESDQWWGNKLSVLKSRYPYFIECPLDNLYGMHVFSKLKLKESKIHYLVQPGTPSIHTYIELRTGDMLKGYFLHPPPPSPVRSRPSTQRDAELVLVAKEVSKNPIPTVVAGDLNDVAWSYTTRLFRKISGLLDPRVGRGMFNTFHAKWFFMRWPLDHLFHSDHFRIKDIRRLNRFGSDHFPLLTTLCFQPNKDNGDGLDASEQDEKRANEKLEETS